LSQWVSDDEKAIENANRAIEHFNDAIARVRVIGGLTE
jgi:hypothetical protein